MSIENGLTRAHYHLTGWGQWRRKNAGQVTRGYPSKSAGVESGGGSEEFDHMVEREDSKAAAICEAVIDDLPLLYRRALESEYVKSMAQSAEDILIDAQAAFWVKARKLLT